MTVTDIKIMDDGRKIFYIDIGDMPTEEAMEYLTKIKKEIQSKKAKK